MDFKNLNWTLKNFLQILIMTYCIPSELHLSSFQAAP